MYAHSSESLPHSEQKRPASFVPQLVQKTIPHSSVPDAREMKSSLPGSPNCSQDTLAQERAWSEFRTPLAVQPLRTSGLQADPWIHHLGAALRNRERSAVLRSVRLRNRTDSRRTPSAERHTGRGTQASAASPASDVPSSAEARGTRVRRAAANQHFPKEILRKVLIRLVRTSGLNRRLIDSSRSLTVKET